MKIGTKIKLLREGRGWSQARLVQEARKHIPGNKVLARETMSRIENGHRPPDLWVLSALAKALDTTAGELIDGTSDGDLAGLTAQGAAVADLPQLRLRADSVMAGGDTAGLIERLELLPPLLRRELVARVDALLDVLLNAIEGVGLSDNERELLRYLREASPEKQEAIHRLVVAAAEPDARDSADEAALAAKQAVGSPAAD